MLTSHLQNYWSCVAADSVCGFTRNGFSAQLPADSRHNQRVAAFLGQLQLIVIPSTPAHNTRSDKWRSSKRKNGYSLRHSCFAGAKRTLFSAKEHFIMWTHFTFF